MDHSGVDGEWDSGYPPPRPSVLVRCRVHVDSRQKLDERAIDDRRFDKVGRDEGGV